MEFSTFQGTASWIIAHGYALLFLAILIEGPIVTAAGAFAAALGYLNVYAVFGLSILGNLLPDVAFYAIGFWGRQKLAERYGYHVGLTRERMKYLEKLLETHAGKALTIIKLLPILPTPGLILAGATKMPLKKYTFWSIAIIIPSSLFFVIIGYYFGAAYAAISRYVDYGGYLISGFIAVFALVYYVYKKLSRKIGEEIEEE